MAALAATILCAVHGSWIGGGGCSGGSGAGGSVIVLSWSQLVSLMTGNTFADPAFIRFAANTMLVAFNVALYYLCCLWPPAWKPDPVESEQTQPTFQHSSHCDDSECVND
jgi:hypothetical protein